MDGQPKRPRVTYTGIDVDTSRPQPSDLGGVTRETPPLRIPTTWTAMAAEIVRIDEGPSNDRDEWIDCLMFIREAALNLAKMILEERTQ